MGVMMMNTAMTNNLKIDNDNYENVLGDDSDDVGDENDDTNADDDIQ